MSDCMFCRIVDGSVASKSVYQDDQAVAFEDLNPKAPVHVLVIPRRHIASVGGVGAADEGLLGHLMRVGVKVAEDKGLMQSGYRILTNVGPDAGQSVFHLHLHVLGGRQMGWPPG